MFRLPSGSGHVLALRVFPENDFSPYRTIWHRDRQGIGQVPLPARGVLAVGQAAWAILGNDERTLTPREATERPGG